VTIHVVAVVVVVRSSSRRESSWSYSSFAGGVSTVKTNNGGRTRHIFHFEKSEWYESNDSTTNAFTEVNENEARRVIRMNASTSLLSFD